MHELPVTQNILEIAIKHGENAGAQRITNLNIVIGKLASFIDDSIQFYWDILAKDTIAEGAELHFRRIDAEFQCEECQSKYNPVGKNLACPNCESIKVKIISGREFFLESIDIE